MAGIRDKDRGKTRRLILQEAEDIAAAGGFPALTLMALCDTTGLPAPRVRYYVRNTARLQFLVLDALLLRLLNSLEPSTDESAPERLAAMCCTYAALHATGAARRLHTVPWDSLLPLHQSVLRHKQRLTLEAFIEPLRQSFPDMPRTHAITVARALVAMLDAHPTWSSEPGAPSHAEYAGLACQMVLAGCRAAPFGAAPS